MSKVGFLGNIDLKPLCEKILNYKINDIYKPIGNNSAKKKSSKNVRNNDNKLEDIQKTFSIINSLFKKGPNLSKVQKELYACLSIKGFEKLTEIIRYDNPEVGKLAFICLINLLHKNEILINLYCERFGFSAVGNVVCINWLPKEFEEKVTLNYAMLKDIQDSSFNFKQTTKYWKWPNNPYYSDTNVPDPQKYLLGFLHKENDIYMNFSPPKNKTKRKKDGLSDYEEDVIALLEGEGEEGEVEGEE